MSNDYYWDLYIAQSERADRYREIAHQLAMRLAIVAKSTFAEVWGEAEEDADARKGAA